MEFFDPVKKRAHARRLLVGYFLVSIAVAFAALILLLQSYGYDVDRKTGKVIQNGLVFLSSRPVSSDIYVNGVREDNTNAKLVMPSGNYKIELQQEGYRPWQKSFYLDGGSVEQLGYPWLFPVKLVTAEEQSYKSKPMLATASPGRNWLLISRPGSLNTFDLFDIKPKNPKRATLTLPSNLLTPASGTHGLRVVEWSSDNRHLLVRHSYKSAVEFVMIDRANPEDSININKFFNATPSTVVLRDKKFDRLYFYDSKSKTVSSADVNSKKVTTLIKGVIRFKAFKANAIFYTRQSSNKEVQFRIHDDNQDYQVQSYQPGSDYFFDVADYEGHNYSVIVSKLTGNVYIFKDALDQVKQKRVANAFMTLRLSKPQFVSFSQNARFIMAQSGSSFGVYDIEYNQPYYYKLKQKIDTSKQAIWMDGHRPIVTTGGKTLVFDFDGTNLQTLSPSSNEYLPFFNASYTNLLNIAPSLKTPKQYALTTTALVVSP